MTVKHVLARLYLFLFAREPLQRLHRGLVGLGLRGRGYNNYAGPGVTGEGWFIRHVLAPSNPRLCVDIGANTGAFTELLLAATTARIVAFEPLPGPFAELARLAKAHSGRVIPLHYALGAEAGELELHYSDAGTEHASFSAEVNQLPYVKHDRTRMVSVRTLDEVVGELGIDAVDFIKIDTEGFEEQVLRGARETLQTFRPRFVQVECNIHQVFMRTSLWQLSLLLPHYDPYQLLPRGWHRVDPRSPLDNIPWFSNVVFVRRQLPSPPQATR